MGYAAKNMGIRPWEWRHMTVEEANYTVEWCKKQHAVDSEQ